jgi:DNA-binding transcriptional LysR family regulator
MRFNRLDLNLLVALDALLDEKKTTRAADRLNVSQSAISGMLARLREYFEDELLVPVGRHMELTPLGRDLANPVRELLLQIQATVAIRPGFLPGTESRHFRITASDYVISVLMARFVGRLHELAPNITVELLPQSEDASEKLRRGETDLLIIPENFIADDHPHELLFEDGFTCVIWDGNISVPEPLDMETFRRIGHVAPMLGRPRAPTLEERFLQGQGINRRICVTTPDFSSMAQIVVGTQLMATMHTRLAKASQQRLPLKLLAPPLAMPTVRECLQWHRYQGDDPCHKWIRDLLLSLAREEPA